MRFLAVYRGVHDTKVSVAVVASARPSPGPLHPEPDNEDTDLAIINGSFPCFPKGRLHYAGEGSVSVKGSDREDCGFVVRTQTPRPARSASPRPSSASKTISAAAAAAGASLRTRVSGITSVATLTGSFTAAAEVEVEFTVPNSLAEVVVSTRVGNLRAAGFRGAAWLETGAGSIEADRIGGNLVVKTGGGPIEIGRVGGKLRCVSGGGSMHVRNAGSEAICESSGGGIVVDEVRGLLHATTAGGNIHVGKALSTVLAESESGIIEVEQAAGLVTARTRGGMIEIGSARGCTCEASSGGIRVRNQDGPLQLNAGAGHILAELLAGVFRSDSILRSASGDITILIPSNLAVSVLARNNTRGFGGRIVSDFPEIQARAGNAALFAEGSLNGGGPVLQIVAQGGNIYLRRQQR